MLPNPLRSALEQNLGRQRLKDDREEKVSVKRLLIQRDTDFHDQGIGTYGSQPNGQKTRCIGKVWNIRGVAVELNLKVFLLESLQFINQRMHI